MNAGLQSLHPTAMLIAEDSSSYGKVTAPVEYDGLGFDYKWDMGWMNDTLEYFKLPPWERHNHHHKLTFSMMYFYNDLFLLPFSHDEVVHGKATILQKMWGDYEGKFAQGRLLYLYMMTHPGKKLNFMGNEIGQLREWDETREQDWDMLKYPNHDSFHRFITELNNLYVTSPALYNLDYNSLNFYWVQANDTAHCVYVYMRTSPEQSYLVILNMTDVEWNDYQFEVPKEIELKEKINSDWQIYGGETQVPQRIRKIKSKKHMVTLDIPAFSGRIFEVFPGKEPKEKKTKKKKKK
jgi:1,4-alpha-glucan branching enzyme